MATALVSVQVSQARATDFARSVTTRRRKKRWPQFNLFPNLYDGADVFSSGVARMERSAIRGRSLVLGFYHRARFARAIGSMRATKHRLNGRRPMFALARVKSDPPSRSLRCHLNGIADIQPT